MAGDGLAQQSNSIISGITASSSSSKVKCYPQSAHKTLKCHKRDFYYVLCAERVPRAEVIPFIFQFSSRVSAQVQGKANVGQGRGERGKRAVDCLAGYTVVDLQHTLYSSAPASMSLHRFCSLLPMCGRLKMLLLLLLLPLALG